MSPSTIPAPPGTDRSWSVMTLAAHLQAPAAAVWDALCPFIRAHGVGPTFGPARTGHHFWLATEDESIGVTVTDSYLSDAAVAHLVGELAGASTPAVRTEPFGVVIPGGSS